MCEQRNLKLILINSWTSIRSYERRKIKYTPGRTTSHLYCSDEIVSYLSNTPGEC